MAKLIVEKDGGFSCNGNGWCGGSDFDGRANVIRCFNCEFCPSYRREGLNIIDKRGDTTLGDFFK